LLEVIDACGAGSFVLGRGQCRQEQGREDRDDRDDDKQFD
jgi:hypothetical protein